MDVLYGADPKFAKTQKMKRDSVVGVWLDLIKGIIIKRK